MLIKVKLYVITVLLAIQINIICLSSFLIYLQFSDSSVYLAGSSMFCAEVSLEFSVILCRRMFRSNIDLSVSAK